MLQAEGVVRLPKKKQGIRGYRNWLLVLALLVVYGLYMVYWPSSAQVATISTDKPNSYVLDVAVSNPTLKLFSGELTQITTEVDAGNSNDSGGSGPILEALPRTYPFFLLPFQSQTLPVQMNSLVVPAADYDITIHSDTGGQCVFTLELLNSGTSQSTSTQVDTVCSG